MKTSHKHNQSFNETPDFSLVLGGPLFQLLVRSRLATSALELMHRRIICSIALTWLPLFLLTLMDGKAWKGVGLPFLHDIELQARFLLALPLVIAAELLVHQRMRLIVGQFIERDIITEAVLPKFKALIASAMKLRNSVVIELVLFFLVFFGGHYLWSNFSGLTKIGTTSGTWYFTMADGNKHFSLASYWYVFVSRPLFHFLCIRWYFRIFIWARFLWQTSRLELNLIPTHPDRSAGLGFLGNSSSAFGPLLMAHGVLLSGLIANRIFYMGEKLPDFKMEIIFMGAFLLLLVLGPQLFFASRLMSAKRIGIREYGKFASRYVGEFDRKWLRKDDAGKEELLGNGDIQSLADLDSSFQVIRDIKPFPFGKDAVIQLIVIFLIPILPLTLTIIPLEEMFTKIFGIIF